MADSLLLSNSMYLECISLTASSSSGTAYTIITATSSYDRRIYGISIANTSAVNHLTCTLWLSDGTTNYQMGKLDVPANSGNSSTISAVDLFTKSVFSGLLTNSMADNMGVWYFNLPKTWSMKFTYTNTLSTGNEMTFTSFGEIYDSYNIRHTSSGFEQSATFSSATGTNTIDLLSSSIYDRRIYGLSSTSTDGTARTMTIKLSNGVNSYLLYTESILANSGNATTIASGDIFYDALIQGLFTRTADSEGACYYFNLPAGWSITGKLSGSTTGVITIKTIGEVYG
jgi:hypothetical protein